MWNFLAWNVHVNSLGNISSADLLQNVPVIQSVSIHIYLNLLTTWWIWVICFSPCLGLKLDFVLVKLYLRPEFLLSWWSCEYFLHIADALIVSVLSPTFPMRTIAWVHIRRKVPPTYHLPLNIHFAAMQCREFLPWQAGKCRTCSSMKVYRCIEIKRSCWPERLSVGTLRACQKIPHPARALRLVLARAHSSWKKSRSYRAQHSHPNPVDSYIPKARTTLYQGAVTALRFIGCHNQSELYLRARDQSCLSDHSCFYILYLPPKVRRTCCCPAAATLVKRR